MNCPFKIGKLKIYVQHSDVKEMDGQVCRIKWRGRKQLYFSWLHYLPSCFLHSPFISTSPSFVPLSCRPIGLLSHVVFSFQPMNKLSDRLLCYLENIGARLCWRQKWRRACTSVLSLGAPYIWTEWGSQRFPWLDVQQPRHVCGGWQLVWADGMKGSQRCSVLRLIHTAHAQRCSLRFSRGRWRSHKEANQ